MNWSSFHECERHKLHF
uniref:Uncharacterized protein n=1 Tax=Lepeophtheirus salmonis TaxID=72036 RepID=A0A0K2VE77_LEPSM